MSLTDFIDRSRSNPGATRADGRQETEFRIPANGAPDSRTPNPKPQTLQTSIDHRCYDRMVIAGRSLGGRPLRRRRETVLLSATGGCEGPQPSKPPPNLAATAGGPLLADPLEGVRSVGAVKWCQIYGRNGSEGPHLQASTDHPMFQWASRNAFILSQKAAPLRVQLVLDQLASQR